MENKEPISGPISLSSQSTKSRSPSVRKLSRSKSSFSVAFEKHIKNDHELTAKAKTTRQLIKHIFKGKMSLTDRLKLLRKLIRRLTTIVDSDGKFKVRLTIDIVDFIKGFTDLI